MKKNKKGVDLTLNTIIVAVLVVLVLIVVVTFFFGSFKGLTDRVKATFFTTTAGTDELLAVQTCQQYCDQAQLLLRTGSSKADELVQRSAYCIQGFVIEGQSTFDDTKGTYDKVFSCGLSTTSSSSIAKIKSDYNAEDVINLGISCPTIKCK